MLRRVVNGLARLALGGVLCLGVLGVFLWLEHRSGVTLPTPTGTFAVGRTIQDWTDSTTLDTLAPIPGVRRELLVWIWYPASAAQPVAVDDYLPAALHPKNDTTDHANIWTLLTRDVSKVRGHSVRDAAVSTQQHAYPVVILRGGGSSGVLNYSALAEDLASHGYVVVGFDAPYRTSRVVFPDGRIIGRTDQNNPERCVVPDVGEMEKCVAPVLAAWTGDMAFALDRLAFLNLSDSSGRFSGRLDMTRVGVLGHSLGGAVAAQFCHEDSRCSAGIDIDGALHGSVVQAGIRKPFMFLLSDHSRESDPASNQIRTDIQSIYDRMPPDKRQLVTIRGAFHYMFSDDGAIMKSGVVRGVLRILGRLGMSGRRQLAMTAYCVHTFFDGYLKGQGTSRLHLASPTYPEIQVAE